MFKSLSLDEKQKILESLEIVDEYMDSKCAELEIVDSNLRMFRREIELDAIRLKEINKALINKEIVTKLVLSPMGIIEKIEKRKGNFIEIKINEKKVLNKKKKLYEKIEIFNFMIINSKK